MDECSDAAGGTMKLDIYRCIDGSCADQTVAHDEGEEGRGVCRNCEFEQLPLSPPICGSSSALPHQDLLASLFERRQAMMRCAEFAAVPT
jgi:hypothetical protein